MAPRSILFLPAALVLLPACEVEPAAAPSAELCARDLTPEALPQVEKQAQAASVCGESGDPCCNGDSCAEGAECSDGVCVLPFLEPAALQALETE